MMSVERTTKISAKLDSEQGAYVVVQFYPWFKFSCLLFLGMGNV